MANNEEETRNVRYDLGTFVVSVNRLKSHGKPLFVLCTAVVNVIRWKHPFASFFVIPTSLVMIVFCPEYFMGLLLLPLPLVMLINLVRKLGARKTAPFDYKKLFVRKDESPEYIAKRDAALKAKEHLDMYLKIIIEIQEFCNKISTKLEYFYSLFYWKVWRQALLFYLLVICGIIGLFTIRLRYMVALLLFLLSVLNTGFKQAVRDLCTGIYNSISRLLQAKCKKQVVLASFDEEEESREREQEQDMQVKEQMPVAESIADSCNSSDSEDLIEKPDIKPETISQPEDQQGKQRVKHGLSFVSKIASLASIRRRRPGGKCTSCNADFSSILKKRVYCRHCGYSYCSSCCRQRVPRIVFGATAPAAYEERVLVCNSCHAFLMNRMRGTNTEIVE